MEVWNKWWLAGSLLMIFPGALLIVGVVRLTDLEPAVGTALVGSLAFLPILSWLAFSPSTKVPPRERVTAEMRRQAIALLGGLGTGCWVLAFLQRNKPIAQTTAFAFWPTLVVFGWFFFAALAWVIRTEVSGTS